MTRATRLALLSEHRSSIALVDLFTSYLDLADQVTALRTILASSPDPRPIARRANSATTRSQPILNRSDAILLRQQRAPGLQRRGVRDSIP